MNRKLMTTLVAAGLLATTSLRAATVSLDVVASLDEELTEVVVEPGSSVGYWVVVEVSSEPPDNFGLAFFSINLSTDLTVPQPPAEEFEPTIAQDFVLLPFLGSEDLDDMDDVQGITSSQNFTDQVTGIGQGGRQWLVRGQFTTPETEGTFTVSVRADSTANVLVSGASDELRAEGATVNVGSGFTIRTESTVPADDLSGGDGSAPTDGDGSTPVTPSQSPAGAALLVTAGVAALLALAFLLGGPFGLMIGLVIGPLLGLWVLAGLNPAS